jgi:gliding motility-associated-like protein
LDTIALTVMSAQGCTDSTIRIVNVYPTSPSSFTPELIGDCQTVLLTPDTVMAHTGYHWTINYTWQSPDVSPTFYYDANSVANIPMMLIATTEDGCRDTTMSFFPIPDCVNVPNAFSPDGDGLNENFVPVILPGEHFEYLQIFNRWGEMIADINSTRNPRWDGTYGGDPVEVGVYVWRLKLTSRVEPYIGHVTVLR